MGVNSLLKTVSRQRRGCDLTNFHMKVPVPLFCRYMNFLTRQCRTGRTKPPCQKQLDPSRGFDRTPTYDRHGQTDPVMQTQGPQPVVPRYSVARVKIVSERLEMCIDL